MLNQVSLSTHIQVPLIHVINEDDELLSNSSDAPWYPLLKNFPWENYRELGARYLTFRASEIRFLSNF